MELTLDHPGDNLFIRSVSDAGIRVEDTVYQQAIIISATEIITDWPARSAEEFTEALLEPILELQPEIVLIGTGSQQVFLPPELMMYFYRREVGVEVMTTHAACRTFNILISESRKAVAALLPAG